uniref:Uncharacterized protein n=1 Tax=Drosophila melanogaster TaxID=7227 RepID=Q9VXZ7_DROME|nr:uncharacterized protein Dmel_CG9030 [Drosophila melanogaster]AAF48409.2 uncharacterized protein Dmel_CG9030 [Drosophila melanogaster]|eukprot:NP_727815.2 uncharacterized protein Dmel_CG9030 [Drosophila melanogaster]
MYTKRCLSDVLCYIAHRYMDIPLPTCRTYSIWKFPPNFDANNQRAGRLFWFSEQIFPLMFYYALGISIIGSTHNCLEFISILFKKAHLKKSHRLRKVKNFKYKQLRRFRIIGCILMLTAWTILLYALATLKPHYIGPWFVIYATITSIDILLVLSDALVNRTIGNGFLFKTLIPVINLYCVLSVRSTLRQLIEFYGYQDVVWWSMERYAP